MKQRNVSFVRFVQFFLMAVTMTWSGPSASGQQAASANVDADKDLADSVRELREQVQELRTAVSEIKSEAAQYRAENQELRRELESMRINAGAETGKPGETASASVPSNNPTNERVPALEENTQVLQSQVRTLYQSKIESASKYRMRLSGLVLLNMFHNRGPVDNVDVPTWAAATSTYGVTPVFGATLRQSEIGLEVFGPEIAGAKTSGQVQADFGGGFPAGALNGINTGIVRLRTANARLDWANTSVIAGQDGLFVSPNSPTTFASLIVPGFAYSGNLWAWIPQLRVEHRFQVTNDQTVSVQGGILDNVTGESSSGDSHRIAQAGESSGQPAYAARTAWTRKINGRPLTFGASGYYSRQNWGPGWEADGWAAVSDWRIPLPAKFELSGEFYRGRAVGGLGGGIGQSVLFSGSLQNPSDFHILNSAGGWSQLKFSATSRLEFNGAFGADNPFARDLFRLPYPVGVYPTVLTANRSEMMNFIFRPRSDVLFSGEYRHLRTSQIGNYYTADQVNVMMGVLF